MKKIYGLLLGGALTLSLAGVLSSTKNISAAHAASCEFWIGGTNVASTSSMSSGGGTVSYVEQDGKAKVTFNNFVYSGVGKSDSDYYAVIFKGSMPLEVTVNGTNSITCTETGQYHTRGWGMTGYSKKGLTFLGSGSLSVKAANAGNTSYGIATYNAGTITINGPEVKFSSGNISAGIAHNYNAIGVYASTGGPINVNKGKLIAESGNAATYESHGLLVSGGEVNVNGGILEATSGSSGNSQSYGYKRSSSSNVSLIINNGANYVMLAGNNKAADGAFTKEFSGTGYSNKDGTGSSSYIGEGWGTISDNIKCAKFTNEISASATNYDGGYDGEPHTISVNVSKPGDYSIAYGTTQGEYTLSTPPTYTEITSAQTIYYKVTAPACGDYEGSGTVTISKGNPTYTAPQAVSDLKYNGSMQNLITAGSLEGGTMKYRLGTSGEYSSSIPQGDAAGTYAVYYAVYPTDTAHYNNLENLGPVNVTIAKADIAYTSEPAAVTDFVFDNNSHKLVQEGFGAERGDVVFRLGTYGPFTTAIPEVTAAGDYTVYYKIQSDDPNYADSEIKSFTIHVAKAANDYETVPTAVAELAYTGSELELVNAGTSVGGNVVYSVNGGAYSAEIPTAINAGTYTVSYKIDGGNNYEDVAGDSFEVVIAKINSSYETEPSVVENLVYTGEPLTLVTEGSAEGGVVKYRVGEEGDYSETVPTRTEPGTYVVSYFIDADDNHNDSEPKSVTVTIAENDKTVLNKAIENGDKLHDLIKDKYPEIDGPLATALTEGKAVKESTTASAKDITDATTKINEACVNVIEKLVESIGEVKNDEKSKESVEIARAAYESLSDEQKLLVPEKTLADLEAKEAEYKKVSSGLAWWAITLIVVACLAVVFVLLYFLMFYVFHKWIKQDKKAIKVFKCGHKHGKARLFTKSLKVMYRFDEEVFKTKDEALK